jgi:hypothetical protein
MPHADILTDHAQNQSIDDDWRFYEGAEFHESCTVTFKGEAAVLVKAVFHKTVQFTEKKVLINGQPKYRAGCTILSSDTSPNFKHAPLTGRERDCYTQQAFHSNVHFTNPAGVTRFVAGAKVEFCGPVVFDGAVSLVNPDFRQPVTFAAEPEIRELPADE